MKNVLSCRARRRVAFLALASVSTAAIAVAPAAYAQNAVADVQFDIPAQSLDSALVQFTRMTGVQLIYPASLAEGLNTTGVQGRISPDAALAKLLSGTGLTFRRMDSGSITIEKVEGVGGERVLGAVRVQGAQGGGSALAGSTPVNGVNGSRDVTATEGTGSYTSNALTVGSKTAASIKDTPMSVSVITDQQLKDQNITDLNTAMRDAPGITVLHDSASDLSFWSRGFQITQMQIDGGAPQAIAPGGGNNYAPYGNVGNYRPLIDLSLYDHVELVRGATGTFNAYGNPGGVINLVRKRPLDHAQMTIDMQLGSWDWHRFSADVTGPLAFDGKLRVRVIATHQDNNYFYDIAKANRNVLSGTLELDVTPTTLLTAGVTYQDQSDITWSGGLPRYQTGKVIDFPRGRATCLCFPWATNNSRNLEYFGQIEQRIGDNWTLKVKANRIQQKSDALGVDVYGTVDPILGTGPTIYLQSFSHGRVKQTQVEATLDGSFKLFGQNQKILLGANYSMMNPAGSFDGSADWRFSNLYFLSGARNGASIGDVRRLDPYAWQPDPSYGTIPFRGFEYGDYRTLNAYVSFDFSPIERLHIISALRYSQNRTRVLPYEICTPDMARYPDYYPQCVGNVGAKFYDLEGGKVKGSSFGWPPSVQVRYDVNDNLSAYAIYTDIYVDRSSILTRDNQPLPPTTGGNFEGGIKWQASNRKLNVTLSGYYTKQINTSTIQDGPLSRPPRIPGQLISQQYCCYKNDDGAYNLSYGTEFEISGEVAKGLQLSASYTYNVNKSYNPGATFFDGSRMPLQTLAPKHLAKLWASYAFDEGSKLNGLRLGLGAQARSSTFVQDSYCPVDPVSTPDGPQCPNPPGSKPVFFTDPGYIVLSGSIGYRLNDKLSFDVQLENLLDKTYFEQVGGIGGGNWYGSPRSVKVSLRGKF